MKKILTILFLFPYGFVIAQSYLTPFKENDKWGYKFNDEIVVEAKFDYATSFVGDFAIIGNYSGEKYSGEKKTLYMGIIKNLKLICPLILTTAAFSDISNDNNLINPLTKFIIDDKNVNYGGNKFKKSLVEVVKN